MTNRAPLAGVALATLLGLGIGLAQPAGDGRRGAPGIDSETLPRLLAGRGFTPPDTFKALLIEIVPDGKGGFGEHRYDYRGTSTDRDDWWPASTVKLYAAIAALEKVKRLGFRPAVELTFEYEDKPVTRNLSNLIRQAITVSHNRAFDQLVELVGFDELNDGFLVGRNGLGGAVMLRSYAGRVRHPETNRGVNRHSPRIVLRGRKGKEAVLPERRGTGEHECRDQGNCTTLAELAEALRRVMMHEHLPQGQRFDLGKRGLRLLRSAMERRAKGGVVEGLRAAFGDRPIRIYHKGGYSYRWFSDNVFLRIEDTDERWIVSMANHPGREALDEATGHVGALIASGEFKRARAAEAPDAGATE